ncbi:MAG: SusC/RagA family TonB-linked outer membrane protein, partial [Parabacteroides sp.]|nr:SusC/RagA family TonB-linked outer membrane protein [Parabacteroides sp.]
MKDANGRYLVNDVLSEFNPLGILEAGGKTMKDEDNFTGSVNADFSIIDGLKLRGVFGGDLRSNHRLIMRKQVPFYASETATVPSGYANSNRESEDYNEKVLFLNSQVMLDFNRTFGKVHQVTGLLGFSNESYTRKANEIKKKFTDPDLGIPVSETEILTSSYNTPNGTIQRSLYSVFGRAGYSYDGKYYGEFSFRYDGSSKFNSDNRWGFFPSVSGGWRVSEEAFMTDYREKFGELKLRGSYGILGNQNVDDYQYQTTYNINNNAYGFNNVSVAGTGFTFANKELKWELSKTFNVGVDATFFNNALYASVDYFNKRTSDILITPEVPTVYGGAVPKYNAGEMLNQGWEISLGYRFRKGDFRHNIGLNLADSWNEVLAFDGNEQISSSDQMQRIIRVGLPFNSYYGYKTDGYFQNLDEVKNGAIPVGATVQPGDVRYVDRDNNGVIDDKDRFVLGNAFPRYTYGITYDMSWKNFDFSLLLQGVGKRSMFLRGELVEPFHSNYSYTMFTHQLDYWTPVNPDARWPRLAAPGTASNTNNYGKSSDLYLFNAAYLRVKNIQLGYTMPKVLSQKIGMQKLRGYVTAQNLLTLTKNGFIDPESTEFGSNMGNNGANSGRNYPTPIYVGFGLDIEF